LSQSKRALWKVASAPIIVLWSATGERTSAAQTTSENAAQAETLFRDGRALIKAGRTSEACAKFAESHRLDPQIGTLLNLALCHEDEGKTASAWAEFNEVEERSGSKSERAEFAHRHARAVEGKLSRLRVRIDPPVQGLSLTLDARPLRAAALGSLIPLDPGEHAVEAAAPGKERWVERVKIEPGPATQELVVKMVDAPATSPPAATPSASAAPAPAPAREPTSPSTTRRDVGFVIGAVGIVGLGIGAGYGLSALSKKNDYDDKWPGGNCSKNPTDTNNCASAGDAKRDLDKAAIISTIGFAAGAAGVATGLYLVLSAPSSQQASAVRFAPMLARSAAGVTIAGGF
jgi:hypothetical protein